MSSREDWLVKAANRLLDEFLPTLLPVGQFKRPLFCISVGFPKGSSRGTVGQCWPPESAADKRAHIFVSPIRCGKGELAAILGTVLHELLHATVGCEEGHKGVFAKAARAVGMVKPFTHTTPNELLAARLNAVGKELGPMPHGALVVDTKKRPGSRLRLWECDCPVKLRAATDYLNALCEDCGAMFEKKGA